MLSGTDQLSKLRTEMTIDFGNVFRGLQSSFIVERGMEAYMKCIQERVGVKRVKGAEKMGQYCRGTWVKGDFCASGPHPILPL